MENSLDRNVYVLLAIAAGWAVTYFLRALPFLVFGSRASAPAWLRRIDRYISPVMIGLLIVYSFSGLEWKTPWPYAAAAVTAGAYFLSKNPLVGIIAGTAAYMALLSVCGCIVPVEGPPVSTAVSAPVRVTRNGLLFRDRPALPEEIPELLDKAGYDREKTLHILVDGDFDDKRALWVLKHNYIDRAGYTKSVWVHSRRGVSGSAGEINRPDTVTIPYAAPRPGR
ncbi:MAG: AzlD domain-containing protein [Kiritimatiellae bacterium]|nr:AzlD domain-containing protein [Kiritimatiellia bacterium]